MLASALRGGLAIERTHAQAASWHGGPCGRCASIQRGETDVTQFVVERGVELSGNRSAQLRFQLRHEWCRGVVTVPSNESGAYATRVHIWQGVASDQLFSSAQPPCDVEAKQVSTWEFEPYQAYGAGDGQCSVDSHSGR